MDLLESIQNRRDDFLALCGNHNVKRLYAFGSSITAHFDDATSDIDLLIEMKDDDPILRGQNLISIWDKFEQFFQRKVDLLTDSSIGNPILRMQIDSTKVLIYDGEKQKVSV